MLKDLKKTEKITPDAILSYYYLFISRFIQNNLETKTLYFIFLL